MQPGIGRVGAGWGWAMGVLEFFRDEWAVIGQAPATFVIAAAIIGGGVWWIAGLYYKGRIDTLKERIDALKDAKTGSAKWS